MPNDQAGPILTYFAKVRKFAAESHAAAYLQHSAEKPLQIANNILATLRVSYRISDLDLCALKEIIHAELKNNWDTVYTSKNEYLLTNLNIGSKKFPDFYDLLQDALIAIIIPHIQMHHRCTIWYYGARHYLDNLDELRDSMAEYLNPAVENGHRRDSHRIDLVL